MKIAIIGSGISGLGAAYLLFPDHQITLYEKNDYLGGHARTINVTTPVHQTPVDTGFIVFNNWNYPNLMGLFDTLGVPYQKSDMSFGVSIGKGWLEYASGGLFGQRRNYLRPRYWGMLLDVLRFNRLAPAYIEKDESITLAQCLDELGMGKWFRQYYILAMGAAIWSCPIETIMQYPAKTFLRFFKNHGLLNIKNRPQWYTVTGGSREYIARLTGQFSGVTRLQNAVLKVRRKNGGLEVEDVMGTKTFFDQVIFACHADEALSMIENPHPLHTEIIGAFDYQDNKIILHSDLSFMPERRECWSSWVYLSETPNDTNPRVSLSYWMNNLQNLDPRLPLIVTLNPARRPREDLIYDEHNFTHPIFDEKAIRAQERIYQVQGEEGMWFCGAYQRYGFHEDGLLSAVKVAKALGAKIPWEDQ